VVDCTCLENRSLGNRTVSSNLTSSASYKNTELLARYFYMTRGCKVVNQTALVYGDSNRARESASNGVRQICERTSPPLSCQFPGVEATCRDEKNKAFESAEQICGFAIRSEQ
jgi:hypothetical protein